MCKDRLAGLNVCPFLKPQPQDLGAGQSCSIAPAFVVTSLGEHSNQVTLLTSCLWLWPGKPIPS